MKNRSQVRLTLLLITLLFTSLLGQAVALALVIQPGQDGFVTQSGSLATLPDLPTGFFGMKGGAPSDLILAHDIPVMSGPDLVSLPVVTTFLTGPGCHTGMVNIHCYEQQLITLVPIYDTVVMRGGGNIGYAGSLTVPIELVHLSLQSVSPLEVRYGLADPPSFFDIFVSLDGSQSPGLLTLSRDGGTPSGLMNTVLPVGYKIDFKEIGGPGMVQVGGLHDTLQSPQNGWVVVPEPGSLTLLSVGLLGLAAMGRRRRGKK